MFYDSIKNSNISRITRTDADIHSIYLTKSSYQYIILFQAPLVQVRHRDDAKNMVHVKKMSKDETTHDKRAYSDRVVEVPETLKATTIWDGMSELKKEKWPIGLNISW